MDLTETRGAWPRVPYVGVGCIVTHDEKVLLVQSRSGAWSTPGGHLDFGEDPARCARREAIEETGLKLDEISFVAVTNDVMEDRDKHYVTIWMRGRVGSGDIVVGDEDEIVAAGWFHPDALPQPLQPFLVNLLEGRCMPPIPPGEALRPVGDDQPETREGSDADG